MRLPASQIAMLAAVALVSACGSGERPSPLPAERTGPAGDYPMVIGEPFTIDGVTWTPADIMNYDQVGQAAIQSVDAGVSAAHRTLPLPSYVEVTSLETGRTILVRVERRGPMDNAHLIALSQGAAAQLGATAERVAVRVRRVNPPEQERALLRSGQPAPARMDTPRSLLAVLLRKLTPPAPTPGGATGLPSSTPAAPPPKTAAPVVPVPLPAVAPAAAKPATPAKPSPTRADIAAHRLIIQVAAFSTRERADATARRIGGDVSRAGTLWRVRKGPFSSRQEAETALARVRSSGYTDARILRAD